MEGSHVMSLARQLARRCVLEAAPYTWVRPSEPGDLLLLDANENAWRPQGTVLDADPALYPQLNQERLREALAGYAGVLPTQVLATCGADEAIDLLVRTFCEPGEDGIAILTPTYPMYARQAGVAGVAVRESALDLWESGDALAMARDLGDAKLIFLCRPNNPTGTSLPVEAVRALLQAAPGYLVLDEAYVEFADEPHGLAGWIGAEPRLIVLRTLSKAFGLAGIRLGYVLADAATIEVLDLVRLPFNVGVLTAQLAMRALADHEALKMSVRRVRAERQRLAERLAKLPGLEVVPSQANFLLVRVAGSSELCRRLHGAGILVRDRSAVSGCGEAFRVTVGRPEENDRLLAALELCLESRP
jgi:histidinol-phosphate aminotransferase